MVLVRDQPDATNPIVFGAPELGWPGDPRLAVYYWPRRRTYVLVRLCDRVAAGEPEYQVICEMPGNRPLSPAGVNQAIRKLIAIDTRRGFDPHAEILANNARVEERFERRNDEWIDEEMAPRLAWAYGRDRATHLGGRFDQHVVPSVPWHAPKPEAPATKEA